MSIRNLEAVFTPTSVAVIGASDRPGSLGSVVLSNLRQGGFAGPLWPVNLRHAQVGGLRAWPDVASLPAAPDLAVICTPAATVPGLIAALGQRGTRGAVVLSAGLRQHPPEGGPSWEQAMLDAARPHLLRIVGPNCLGVLVPGLGLNASFAPARALPGELAFITQSGALATAMLDWANAQGIGFSHFVSMGDSADVDFGDLLDYLGSDAGTRAILMYAESVKHGRKFMSAARAAARNKPVILVKSGRAPEGARAAASHTGAMAGSDAVFDAVVQRAGLLRVDTLEQLFDAAQTLARVRNWRGDRLAILTNGGGAGVLAADALSLGGGRLATLEPATLAALRAVLPAHGEPGNPADIVGDAPVQRYVDALRVLLDAPEVDGLLFIHAPTAIVAAQPIADALLPLLTQAGKPVLGCWLGGQAVAGARATFAAAGLAVYPTPERAVAGWLQLAGYHRNQQALLELPAAQLEAFRPDTVAVRAIVREAQAAGHEWLDEAQAKEVLAAYGIPVVQTRRVHGADEAAAAAEAIGFPVALKVVSPQVLHKSDVGGVVLGLNSAAAVREAAVRMRQRIAHAVPQAVITGLTVQAMAQRPGAWELIAGVASDPVFGPVLLFGEGGTAVEIRNDRAMALPPLNAPLAAALIERTRIARLLHGYRGRPPVNQAALQDVLLKLSQLACDIAELAELDINPLLADAQGVLALDARVRLRPVAAGERSRLALRPYPAELEDTLVLGQRRLRLRPIRPEDGARLAAFYAGASPEDLRLRFFMSRRGVPPSELARYCQIDYEREMTFIALDGERMAGEVRAACDPDGRRAEFAIQVAGDWQGQGLGRQLLDRMVAYLRARGVAEVTGECLSDNAGMLALARRAGFDVHADADGATVRLRLTLGT